MRWKYSTANNGIFQSDGNMIQLEYVRAVVGKQATPLLKLLKWTVSGSADSEQMGRPENWFGGFEILT